MVSLPYEQILEKLKSKSDLSEQDIDAKISEKVDSFNGLVSKEGAALILANEMGIKIIETPSETAKLKINQLISGMQSVDILGKVIRAYPVRSFSKDGRTGKVGSVVLGDETGSVRVTFWNDKTSFLKDLARGSVLKLSNVYTRQNRDDEVEVSVNDRSEVAVNPEGESIDSIEIKETVKKIKDLGENESDVVVFGTVTDVSDLRFFETCSSCGRRARPNDTGEVYECANKHMLQDHKYSYLGGINLDDGNSIRVVLFKESLADFLGKSDEEILSFRETPEVFDTFKMGFVGRVVKVVAKSKVSSFSGELELIADSIEQSSSEELKNVVYSDPAPAESSEESSGQPASAGAEASNQEENVESSSIEDG